MKDKPLSASDTPLRPLHSFEVDSSRWWTRSGLPIIGIFLIVGFFYIGSLPIRCGISANRSQVVNNARQIGLALHEFEQKFGQFPDETTVERVRLQTSTDMKLDTKSSNAMFRQLLATGVAQGESMFYAKIAGSKVFDGKFTGNHALEKGECGFAYISGLKSEGDPSRPLVITPLIPGTDRFDYKRFDGKAIILKMDDSVTSLNIIKSTGQVKMNGKNILDPANPIWAGEKWKLLWPE